MKSRPKDLPDDQRAEVVRKANAIATDVELMRAVGLLYMAGFSTEDFARVLSRSQEDIDKAYAAWTQAENIDLRVSTDGRWAIIMRKKGGSA